MSEKLTKEAKRFLTNIETRVRENVSLPFLDEKSAKSILEDIAILREDPPDKDKYISALSLLQHLSLLANKEISPYEIISFIKNNSTAILLQTAEFSEAIRLFSDRLVEFLHENNMFYKQR